LVLPKKRKNAPLAVEERKENARRQNAAGGKSQVLRPCFPQYTRRFGIAFRFRFAAAADY